jgi:alpha-tubulin suppressor-like RCC1 family protein
MGHAEADLRDRLERVGLAAHLDALVELSSPAIRLASCPEPSGLTLGRPPAAARGVGSRVTAIAGSYHQLALRNDGTVAAWGENRGGQLGDGTRIHRRTPVEVPDLPKITAVAAGSAHSLALSSSGGVLAWGCNQWGELGDGTQNDRHRAVPVPELERDVIAIAAGRNVSLALTSDGAVFGWGLNPALEPGDAHAAPIRCRGLEGIVAVAAGGSERLALTSEGMVLAWGSSPSDLSGTGGVLGPARWGSAPRPVEGLPDSVRAIAAGDHHSLALSDHGAVFAWGRGHLGPLGDGTAENRYPPVRVQDLGARVRAISACYGCSYALLDSGAVLSWGWNNDGRLGDGSVTSTPDHTATKRLAPGPVPALAGGVAAISEFVALMDDGSVRAWGGEYQRDEGGTDARLDLGATKLGGRPDLRSRSRWQTRNGRPLAFVAQVDLAQAAPLDRTGLLPRAGLLSFFYGDPAGPRTDGGSRT